MAKTLIAYFSHAGQNYSHGGIRDLAVGNTEVVAKKIHDLIDSDLFYIDTVQKYPDDHMKKIEVAQREFNENARPELTARVENMEEYDTVIVRLVNTDAIRLDDEFRKEYHGFPFSCGLDIFPLDYIPRDPEERDVQKNLLGIVSAAMAAHFSDSEATEEEKETLITQVEQLTGQPVDRKGNIVNQMACLEDALSAMYEEKDADHMGIAFRMTYGSDEWVLHPKEDYKKGVEMPFENTTIMMPIGYEDYVSRQYGKNYMEYSIYPAHDYPFYRSQMSTLKEYLTKQNATLADINLPDIERTDFSDYQ